MHACTQASVENEHGCSQYLGSLTLNWCAVQMRSDVVVWPDSPALLGDQAVALISLA